MNASLDPRPAAKPPLLPSSWIPKGYREKIHRYTMARRSYVTRFAVPRLIAVEIALAIAAILTDVFFEASENVRWGILAGLAVAAIVMLVLWWWLPARKLDEPAMLRELERKMPSMGQRLRTSREAEGATSDPGLAGVFASGLVAETRVRMSDVDATALIPWEKLRPSLYAALAMAALFAALYMEWPDFHSGAGRLVSPGEGLTFTHVALEDRAPNFTDHESPMIAAVVSGRPAKEVLLFTREEGAEWKSQKLDRASGDGRYASVLTDRKHSFDYYVQAGDGRSEQRHLHCMLTPRLAKVEAEIVYPDYLGMPAQKVAGGDLKAVEDSKVTITFQIDPPLTVAMAHTTEGRELPLKIAGSAVVLEQKLTRGETVYQISGSDAEGLDLPPASFKLTGIEDKPPEVELVEPKNDLEATSVWEILARLRAKDDFGLAEVGIVLVVGNDIKMIAHREISEKGVRMVSEMGTAALEEFPLTINDNLKIYAFARDHKPRDGARSVSRLVSIDIRQFQVRWRLRKSAPSGKGEPGPNGVSGEHLRNLLELIKDQRKVVSDTFMLKENGAPRGGELGSACDKIKEVEDAAAKNTTALKKHMADAEEMNGDDLTMLDTGAQQMGEASGHLAGRMTRPAYKQADRALSSLLALRKEIMKELTQRSKNDGGGIPDDAQEEKKPVSASDLAAEAARLAQEEREVREKVTAEAQAPRDQQVTRHQQEVAVTDAGELFAALVRHPETTELVLQRMEDAEKRMEKAETQMRGEAGREAAPDLKAAEETLNALATQLRALDGKNLEDTMGKLAQMAGEAKERVGQEQKQREKREQNGQNGARQQGDEAGKNAVAQQQKNETAKGEDAGKGQQAKAQGQDQKQDGKAGAEKGNEAGRTGAGEKGDQLAQNHQKSEQAKTGDARDNAGKNANVDPTKEGPQQGAVEPKGNQNDGAGEKGTEMARTEEKGTNPDAGKGNDAEKKGDADKGTAGNDGKRDDAKGEKGADAKSDHGGMAQAAADGEKGKADGRREKGGVQAGRDNGGEADRAGLGKVAENAETIDDVLKKLANREDAGKEAERLTELRKLANTEKLKPDVQVLGKNANDADAARKARELSDRFSKLAEALKNEQGHMRQSHIEELTDLLARTRQMEQQAAKAPGEHKAKGGKGGEAKEKNDAKADDAKANNGGKGRNADPNGKNGAGNNARANPPTDPDTPKPQPDVENKEDANATKNGGAARQGNGHPPQDETAPEDHSKVRIGGNGGVLNGPLGNGDADPSPNSRFVRDLQHMSDEKIRGLIPPILEDLREDRLDISHLQPIANRLAELLDELEKSHSEEHRASGVPDEYSHLVDDYFRALSEDYRSEGAPAP